MATLRFLCSTFLITSLVLSSANAIFKAREVKRILEKMANPSHTIRTKNTGPYKRRDLKDTKSETDSEKLDKDEDNDDLKKPPEYKLHVHPRREMFILWVDSASLPTSCKKCNVIMI